MFAPPIKATKAKTALHAVPTRAHKEPHHTSWHPGSGIAERLLMLQRAIGNQATQRLLAHRTQGLTRGKSNEHSTQETDREQIASPKAASSASWDFSKIPVFSPDRASRPQTSSPLVQPKLAIGQVNDPLEHEADHIANQMMQAPTPEPSIGSAPLQLSRMCADCEEEDEAQMLQTKAATMSEPAAGYAPGAVYKAIGSPGQPLDASARTYFEPRFGHDFSRVRVHSDSVAHEAAVAVNANAYTVGSHLVFAAGQYAPHTQQGKQLLAHELTHVVQQSDGETPRLIRRQVFKPRKPAEPRKQKQAPPKKDLAGCTAKDLSTPAALHCVDKGRELENKGRGDSHVDCSRGQKKCCETDYDKKGNAVTICEDLSAWASRQPKNLKDV